MKRSHHKTDVLVIGAGPSGSVAASYLKRKGYTVTIIEKEVFPRFAIGESLLPISMEHFEEAGLLDSLKKADFNVKNGAVFKRGEKIFHIKFSENFTPGWTWTWQVPREDFDKILADATEEKGVEIWYNSLIEVLERRTKGFSVEVDQQGTKRIIEAGFIIDASGKGLVASMIDKSSQQSVKTNRKALFTRVREGTFRHSSERNLIYFDVLDKELWFWVIPFSTNETSIGFVGDSSQFTSTQTDRELNVNQMLDKSPFFKDRFFECEKVMPEITSEEYTKSSEKLFGDGYVLIGNSMGFQDPVFSSGVAIATSSAIKAAKMIDKELQGKQVDWENDYKKWIDQGALVFKNYIDKWYDGSLQKIFFHDNIMESTKKQITSVLAGYVWDQSNPFVKSPDRLLNTLVKVIEIEKKLH